VTAKLSFRTWLNLESQKKNLEAVETGEFPDKVFAFLSTASVPFKEADSWENTVFILTQVLRDFRPDNKLPILKDAPDDGKNKPASWDYEGRNWALWSHLLAKNYGWTLEYIGDLDVNEALARVQEILTDEQLEKEFIHSLSEVAYPYNKSTKKQHYKPLSRPYWMKAIAPEIKMVKFNREFLPMGLVHDMSGMPLEFNPLRDTAIVQKKTEKTDAPPSP
jgi:hypothetical protein